MAMALMGAVVIAANSLYGLARFTRESRSFCLQCHDKGFGTQGLWDVSPMHPEGMPCIFCHTRPGQSRSGPISARPDTVHPNCVGCHWTVLEANISQKTVVVVEADGRDRDRTEHILYRWPLRDVMYTWHLQKRICLCTDCHRNVAHDRGDEGIRYMPRMAYCAECHYHAAKDEYAQMEPLPILIVEEKERIPHLP